MNGGVKDAIEYSGRVDTKKWRCRGCDRIFWSSRYEKIDVTIEYSGRVVQKNGGVKDAIEYSGRVEKKWR